MTAQSKLFVIASFSPDKVSSVLPEYEMNKQNGFFSIKLSGML